MKKAYQLNKNNNLPQECKSKKKKKITKKNKKNWRKTKMINDNHDYFLYSKLLLKDECFFFTI